MRQPFLKENKCGIANFINKILSNVRVAERRHARKGGKPGLLIEIKKKTPKKARRKLRTKKGSGRNPEPSLLTDLTAQCVAGVTIALMVS